MAIEAVISVYVILPKWLETICERLVPPETGTTVPGVVTETATDPDTPEPCILVSPTTEVIEVPAPTTTTTTRRRRTKEQIAADEAAAQAAKASVAKTPVAEVPVAPVAEVPVAPVAEVPVTPVTGAPSPTGFIAALKATKEKLPAEKWGEFTKQVVALADSGYRPAGGSLTTIPSDKWTEFLTKVDVIQATLLEGELA